MFIKYNNKNKKFNKRKIQGSLYKKYIYKYISFEFE